MHSLHHEVCLEGGGGRKHAENCRNTRNMGGFATLDVEVVCHMIWDRTWSGCLQ